MDDRWVIRTQDAVNAGQKSEVNMSLVSKCVLTAACFEYSYSLWWVSLIVLVPALLLLIRKVMQEQRGQRRARWLLPVSVVIGYASQFVFHKLFWLGPRFIPNVWETVPILNTGGPAGVLPLRALSMAWWYAWIQYAIPVIAIAVGVLAYHFLMVKGCPDGEIRCRKCQYILKGITEPRCPECGERI